MQVGFAAGLGLSLPELLKVEARGAAKFYESKEGVAKSLIHIYLPGGCAHQETWDPKPYAPAEYRGPWSVRTPTFRTRRSSSASIPMGNTWPRFADRSTVSTSMIQGCVSYLFGQCPKDVGLAPGALQPLEYGMLSSAEIHHV